VIFILEINAGDLSHWWRIYRRIWDAQETTAL